MVKLIRSIALGVAAGGTVAALYVGLSAPPAALADEGPLDTIMQSADDFMPSHRIDPATLVRIGDEAWSITTDASVSLAPVSTSTVSKVGFGRVTTVRITTTASGVYSSDAMISPHIRYPGVHVQRVRPQTADAGGGSQLAYWSPGYGWIPSPPLAAGSFVLIAPFSGGVMLHSPEGSCALIEGMAIC